ncbi:hypothetical protein GGR56DRAFT_460153 [Xylariaceae sp. FL0804]|nr:hypothetical protein GGR56DRAFT_460153 [Xylariaceae sp. FL0804]
MADQIPKEDGDVQMGGTGPGPGTDAGPGSGNAPPAALTDGGATEQSGTEQSGTEQSGTAHTSLTFEVKPDPEGTPPLPPPLQPQQQQQQEHEQQPPQSQPQPQPQAQQPASSPPAGSPKMARSAPKKKGTAAAKKGPKKPRGATKKAKGGGAGPASNKKRNAEAGAGADEQPEQQSSSDAETDNGPYCLCRGPDDHRWMIGCDVCEDWFHGECVDLDKETGERLVERFVCPNCSDGRRNYTKYRKTCSLAGCRAPARLYDSNKTSKNKKGSSGGGGGGDGDGDRSVFCCNDHCDAWWAALLATLPAVAASRNAVEVLTQQDFMGLLASTAEKGGWKLGDKPFGSVEGLWGSNGLPARAGVLSDEEQVFLQTSAAERLALGNEVVQYKKMMQLVDWANQRRQAAVEAGRFTKDSCGYDRRLDTVSTRVQFAAWLDTPEGQATFKAGRLLDDAPPPPPPPQDMDGAAVAVDDTAAATTTTTMRGACDRKRCKPHAGWYKLLMSAVRVLVKETATAAKNKLDAEEVMRRQAEARYERRQLENNWVEVLE